MLISRKLFIACLAALGGCLLASPVDAAYTLTFKNITHNNAADAAIGEAQMTVEVSDAGGGQVAFKFMNAGPEASSITHIYFDDGTLLDIASITDSGGTVDFAEGASPGNLPGGNTIDFNTSAGFLASSTSPTQPNGVNPGEWVTITFTLQDNKTYADTIAALELSLANPGVDMTNGLRIGIKVQGFDSEGSEGFVNHHPTPAPPSIILAASGAVLFGIGGLVRRFRRPGSLVVAA